MRRRSGFSGHEESGLLGKLNVARRAFREFLAVPSLIILLFIALAIFVYVYERSSIDVLVHLRAFLKTHLFANSQATSGMLTAIASGIITVTSITITLLLLIVQQSAASLTTEVFDQFLRRRSNQMIFGYFIGLALFTLITLATVDEPFNPIFAATLAFLLTVVALYLLILIFYSTIHQMRPPVIIEAIHDHTLAARKRQEALLRKTLRKSRLDEPQVQEVTAGRHGFVTGFNLAELTDLIKRNPKTCEILLVVSIGRYVSYGDVIAEVKGWNEKLDPASAQKVREAVRLELSRDLDNDPAYGIEQLEIMGWSATSTAKGNVAAGLQVVYSLRDLLARWIEEDDAITSEEEPLPIVYNDNVVLELVGAFESLAVVASQSLEHQLLTEILNTFTTLYRRLPDDLRFEIRETIQRILPTVPAHIITRDLEMAGHNLVRTLQAAGERDLANAIQTQLEQELHGAKQI